MLGSRARRRGAGERLGAVPSASTLARSDPLLLAKVLHLLDQSLVEAIAVGAVVPQRR
jgi:hypothetical protein